MSELKAIRLPKAATTYNVGTEHIIDELKRSGFEVENNPNTKLTAEMVAVLEKAFNKDKAIKAAANDKVLDKPEAKTLELATDKVVPPSKREEEEELVLIKSNKVVSKETVEEPKPTEQDKIEREVPKLEGPKVIGKLDLDKKKKEPAKKVEEPIVKEVKPPVQEVKKKEDKKVSMVAPPMVQEILKAKTTTDEPQYLHTKRVELEGPKVMGKIELKEEKKPTPPKQEEKRVRKRIEKPKRERVAPTTQSPGDQNKFKRFDRQPNKSGSDKSDAPKEISEKEIEDKIKATMSKIQAMTSKNDRSKIRREKREAIQEKKQAEIDGQETGKLQVTEFISVSELASLMGIAPIEIIKTCMGIGVIVSINQRLDAEIIELICNDKGFEVEFISAQDQTSFEEVPDSESDLVPRAPIVTIMGHVDHGKTSLLDYIRNANVVAKEAGGITQHIGAYDVTTANGKKITFLDTPGHEAFTAMRARGAKVTDIAVIVIAADDAIMPQTKEAINHAQSAGVPMIFAINKIDKDGAAPDKIREQLANMNLLVEEWGGKYQSQEISAKKGLNIDALLDKILLEAEMLDLKANPNRMANGSIIEASLDKGRGYTTTVLVQGGTLKAGDIVVAGPYYGKVKAMTDHTATRKTQAGPSIPVQILGLNGAPQAGELFKVFDNEQDAKALAFKRSQIEREIGIRTKKHITLEEIGRRLALGNFKELNLILKGDVDGSVEALADSLQRLSTSEIQINILHKGVGQISESDVLLATASDAIVIGFNVRPSANAKKIADNENIEIKLYSIIYNAIEEIKSAMEGLLEPTIEEKIIGNLEVREVFNITKVGTIAGCFVKDGRILRQSKLRVIRDGIVLHTGNLTALKRFKDDVKEVISGMDCGVQLKDYQNILVGDLLEVFEEIEIQRKL
jgi:translation initiation factor IF-2